MLNIFLADDELRLPEASCDEIEWEGIATKKRKC
jgi:hypothetical protein